MGKTRRHRLRASSAYKLYFPVTFSSYKIYFLTAFGQNFVWYDVWYFVRQISGSSPCFTE